MLPETGAASSASLSPILRRLLHLPPRHLLPPKRKSKTVFALRLLLVLFISQICTAPAAEKKPVTAKEAAQLVAAGQAVLVDVREPPEWQDSGVATPAVLLPMSDFHGEQKLWKDFLAKNRDKQILLYCRSGSRSEAVAGALRAQGLNATDIGTLRDWTRAGLPVRKVE